MHGGANCTSRRREMNNESICIYYCTVCYTVLARARPRRRSAVASGGESPAGLR